MTGKLLLDVLDRLLTEHPDALVLVDGNTLCGDFAPFIRKDRGRFVFVRDYMGTGAATPEILSPEFVALRVKEFNYPHGKNVYTEADYEREIASKLRAIVGSKGTEIILVQFDCHMSQIWQLTMQAYIEQVGLAEYITRVVFCEKQVNHFCSALICCSVDRISVAHAHEGYCKLVCQHQKVKLSHLLISASAVKSYLDVNSDEGELVKYIRAKSSTLDNPFCAIGLFLRDFPRLGLGDMDFFRIAYNVLEKDRNFSDVVEKWGRKMKQI